MKAAGISKTTRPVRRVLSSGRPRRRVARAKPFDPGKHLGVIHFKEDIETVIRKMREGNGQDRG